MNPVAADFQNRLDRQAARQNLMILAISACALVAALYWLYTEQAPEASRLYFNGLRASWIACGVAALILLATIVVAVKQRQGPQAWLTDAGVHSRDTFIPWDDIATVHVYTVLYNGAPIRHLRATGADGKVVKFEYGAVGQEVETAFEELRDAVLERVGPRQWNELTERLDSGQSFAFIPGLDVYALGVSMGGEIVPWSRIRGYDIDKGMISLVVDDGAKTAPRKVGMVAETANLHLFLHLLDQRTTPA